MPCRPERSWNGDGRKIACATAEERWRRVFENSAIGIALTDLDGHFLATNAAYQGMLGYTEEELRLRSWLDVTHEDDRKSNWALFRDFLKKERQQFQLARGWLDHWHVDIGQPGFSPFGWVAAAYVVESDLFGCAVTNAWIADEWAFWLYPRPSLLVGPATPVNVTVKAEVVYCPQANPSLHGYLLTGETPFVPGFWDRRGWGFGLSIITRHDDVAAVPDGSAGTAAWARPGNRTSSRK